MSADDPKPKGEFAYLSSEIVDLWRTIARMQDQIARLCQDRIDDLQRKEPPRGNVTKLN
jgi:uncharacterized coiled-coil protein SlyX